MAALSLPRGNGKSTLAAELGRRLLTPGDDPLHVPGTESHIISASLGQSRRTTFKLLRLLFEGNPDYRIADNQNDSRVTHKDSGTAVSVLAANHRTAQGLVGVPLCIADEPGSWETAGGAACWEAIEGALRKPDTPGQPRMRILAIGTLGPALGGWWHDLIRTGSTRTVYVQALIGDRAKWDDLAELRRVNPLVCRYREQWRELRELRDKARLDPREKAAFLTRHCNQPTPDESKALLTVEQWDLCRQRRAPDRRGRPVVGMDLGEDRAWSSAVALWPNGRVEAIALCPGIPDIRAQEKRDNRHPREYQRLVDAGKLVVSEGKRVPEPRVLLDAIRQWSPVGIWADRFKLGQVFDSRPPAPIHIRKMLPSERSEDIAALRRLAADGPLAPVPGDADLIETSLSVSTVTVRNGLVEMTKDNNNRNRDDTAAALVLASGAHVRRPKPRRLRVVA